MPERLAPEEAWREAQFIQNAAHEQATERGAQQADAADYESTSGTLDTAQQDDQPQYERLLRLGELASEAEPADPKLREAFLRIVNNAAEPVKDSLKQRAGEIRLYAEQQALSGKRTDVARKEKITQVVDEYLSQVLERVDRALNEAPEFKRKSRETAEGLEKLKRYHLGPETQATWKDYVGKVLERLTDMR
jgi:hypothetical protein